MASPNPYQSPAGEDDPNRWRSKRSFWGGPLLTVSVCLLLVSFLAAAIDVVPELQWGQLLVVVGLAAIAVL